MALIAPGAHKDSSFACENTMAKRSHHAKGSLVLKDYTVVKIDVSSIVENPMQPKGRCEDVEELFESILATKTLVPIIVVRDPEVPNRYIACNGHRRLTVAREAGLKKVGDRVNLDGVSAEVTVVDQTRVYEIEGKAPDWVSVGDVAQYFNAEAGGKMWVVSWSGDEVECYRGMQLHPGAVAQALRNCQKVIST